MDTSRTEDLKILNERMNNHALPCHVRKRAEKTYHRIRLQLADDAIARMRHRLIGALCANDTNNIERISQCLEEYEVRQYGLPEGV